MSKKKRITITGVIDTGFDNVTLPKFPLLVSKNFKNDNPKDVIGDAVLSHGKERGQVNYEANVELDEKLKKMMDVGVAGQVLERDGDVIKAFKITSVSLINKQKE